MKTAMTPKVTLIRFTAGLLNLAFGFLVFLLRLVVGIGVVLILSWLLIHIPIGKINLFWIQLGCILGAVVIWAMALLLILHGTFIEPFFRDAVEDVHMKIDYWKDLILTKEGAFYLEAYTMKHEHNGIVGVVTANTYSQAYGNYWRKVQAGASTVRVDKAIPIPVPNVMTFSDSALLKGKVTGTLDDLKRIEERCQTIWTPILIPGTSSRGPETEPISLDRAYELIHGYRW